MVDAESRTGDEWTPDERRRLDALATERSPSADLEARTLSALRGRGLLAPGERPRARRVLMLAMAASAVFAAGVGAGYLVAMRAVSAREAAAEGAGAAGGAGAASGAAGAASAPSAGARPETLAARTSGGRQVTWY